MAQAIASMLPKTDERLQYHSQRSTKWLASRDSRRLAADWATADSASIRARLAELHNEWDVERLLMFNASLLTVVSLTLGLWKASPWPLLFALGVVSFLLQHAIQGWCPPLPIFRALGVRTAAEIHDEMAVLHILAGDADELWEGKQPAQKDTFSRKLAAKKERQGALLVGELPQDQEGSTAQTAGMRAGTNTAEDGSGDL